MTLRWFLPRAAFASLLLGFGQAVALDAQAEDDQSVPQTSELAVRPAPEPRPALKYRLFPAMSERKPGNAAPYYYRAIILQRNLPKEYWKEHADKQQSWEGASRQDFPKEEVAKWLAAQRNVLSELKQAAYREYCDWNLRPQDLQGTEVFAFLLPEMQECRELARTLRLKARYEMLDGRPDDAFQTLRLGYRLARDAAQPPYIVCGLVGVAVANIMNEELRRLIEESDSNYYWAIASLPQPLVDLRPALEFEMNSPFQVFPFLRDAETAVRTPDEWRQLIVRSLYDLRDLGGTKEFQGWQGELVAAALLAKLYPVAKQELVAGGMVKEKVEAMPVGQVVGIQTARATEYAYHEMYKVSLLPYDQALRRMPAVMKALEKDIVRPDAALSGRAGLPIASLLLPAVSNILQAEVRTARGFAALQAIEAIRMHAAASGGKLPPSLADVTIVSVPNNPATGQPFPYKLDAASGSATLDVPPVGNLTPRQDGKRYVIRLK